MFELTEQMQKLYGMGRITWQDCLSMFCNKLLYNEDTDTLYINSDWRWVDTSGIKKIGVTGSYGKTSVCEMLYQYLRAKNKGCILICTNGIFVNDITIVKDFLGTTPTKYEIDTILEALCGLYQIDYVVIEVTAESSIHPETQYKNFDVIGITNFSNRLVGHFDNSLDYYKQCKNNAFLLASIRLAPDYSSIPNNKFFDDNDRAYFSYTKLYPIVSNFRDYNNNQLNNWSCAKAILEEFDEYTLSENEIPDFYIRGRYETFLNGQVILDTGWSGINSLLGCYANEKIKLIYIPIYDANPTEYTAASRQRQAAGLAVCEHIYVSNPKEITEEKSLEYFNEYLLGNTNAEYVYLWENCVRKALIELQNDEMLIIMCRENFREFKHILNDIIEE